ncbi:MAG: ferritin-like domain-containing protein [Acidobacteriota bacterium]
MSKALSIGSSEHKELFCRSFIETHDPFLPSDIRWPDLDSEGLDRLKGLPVWNEAVRTEAATAVKVQALGKIERDPIMGQAIRLQGFEESRHAEVIQRLTRHYGIPVDTFPPPQEPANPTWAFLRTGYGECLDSFFAFGLFELGKRSELFPEGIISVFETIMQEEARHILFIVNWAAYLRAQRSLPMRPVFDLRRAWNIAIQAFDRLKGATQMAGGGKKKDGESPRGSQDGFTLKSHTAFGDFSLRAFLELCLAENARRFAPYDARLLRPMLVPSVVKTVIRVLPRHSRDSPARQQKAA